MSGSLIGALRVTLGIDTAAFEEGLGIAQKRLNAAGRNLQQVGERMSSVGSTLSVAVTAPLLAAGAAAIQGAQAQAQAMAQVNAALASMGPVAGRTAEQLLAASDALELNSLYDGDEILSKVTANLLTFGSVAGREFDRAQQAALDLSTRLGTDLQASTVMIGKALNDPIQGISALRRVGIQLTEDQQNLIRSMVETGNTAGAQGIILSELERQFGGAARAAADTSPWRRAQVAIGQAGDAIGEMLLPVISQVSGWLEGVARSFTNLSPGMQSFIVGAAAVAAAVGPVLVVLGSLVSAVGALLPVFAPLVTVIGAAFGAGGVFAGAFSSVSAFSAMLSLLAGAAAPVLAPLAAVAAVGALIWANWDKIGPVLAELRDRFVAALGPKLTALVDTVKTKLTELWNGPFGEAIRWVIGVLGEFGAAYTSVMGEALIRIISAAVDIVTGAFSAMIDAVQLVIAVLTGDWAGAWEAAKSLVSNAINTVLNVLNSLAPGAGDAVRAMASRLWDGLTQIVNDMLTLGRNIVQGLVNGIRQNAEAVWNALKSVVLRGVENIREFLGIASPSRLFMEMGGFITAGLALGIENGTGTVRDAMNELGSTVASGLSGLGTGEGITLDPTFDPTNPAGAGSDAANDMREAFRQSFSDGIKAALDGDLKGFFQSWFEGAGNRAMENILNAASDALFDLLTKVLGGAGGAGSGDLGSVFTSVFSSIFGRASGGPVLANKPYIVGEKRPELFVPSTAGRIVPNMNELGRRGANDGLPPSMNFNFYGPVTNPQEVRRSAAQAGAHLLRISAAGKRGV